MKRTLVIIRHAKSSWANPLQSDFDRPLNDRGKNEVEEMGKKLKALHIIPDIIIASSAKRTRQTAKKIAKLVDFDADNIKWEEKLYHCIPSVLEEEICGTDDKMKTVFIVGHNPGITEFVNQLSPDFNIDNMPTCGVVGVHLDIKEWNNFSIAKRKVFLFEYPGNERNNE
jgi:phosphohistidine phosphatase